MKYRTFGRTGWKVSEIGFGAWAIGGSWGPQDDNDSVAALNRALDLGVNFIDTAQGYGDGKSERVIAQALKSRNRANEKVYVATKIPPSSPGDWPPSPYDRAEERYPEKYLRERLERSLRDLQTDAIDIVQLHGLEDRVRARATPNRILQRIVQHGSQFDVARVGRFFFICFVGARGLRGAFADRGRSFLRYASNSSPK